MAVSQQVSLKTEFSLHHERNDDTVTDGSTDAGFGQGAMPVVDLDVTDAGLGDNTLGICNCQGSATFSIATASTVTLVDFATDEDRLGVALSGILVKYLGVTINAPDGTKALRVGAHSVSGGIAWGLGGTIPYLSIEHHQVFAAPYNGFTGTKIVIANNSGVTVVGNIAYAGKR